MRLTERDVRLLRDLALSHVLSRDQVIDLGYYGSITRANTRLRELCDLGLASRIATPFFAQSLYVATRKAGQVVGERIANLIAGRAQSPRFLQHALVLTNVRIELVKRGATAWRFEQQIRVPFTYGGREYQVRPDGMAVMPDSLLLVEADLGHVAPAKFKEKLMALDAFVASGECQRLWKQERPSLLTLTTGRLRAAHLRRLAPAQPMFEYACQTFSECGVKSVGGWS